MKFTPEQQRVIDLRGCNILVSAAAGSGKTAVLVERIVQLVSGDEERTDIDRLLVVTFTNAAASQMKERITAALSQRLENDPDNIHLQRQLTLIHNAQITTIDSFCLYVIRNHFNDIDLDPDFRIADEGEGKLLEEDVLRELIEEQFQKKDPAFHNCVECFSTGSGERRLEELVLSLYEFSMSYPWPEEWLKRHREALCFQDAEATGPASWIACLLESAGLVVSECMERTRHSLRLCEQPGGPYMYAQALEADLAKLEPLCGLFEDGPPRPGRDTLEQLYRQLSAFAFARLPGKKDESVQPEIREQVKKEREGVKNLIGELYEKFFYCSPDRWAADMDGASKALQSLVDLTLLFKERMDAKKREKNMIDFHDMEHMALQILLSETEDGKLEPSRAALEYREHYREILIDEYQDSNLVQELLLKSISGEDEDRFNRFMVGDVKQSIYKFRLARPELFMEKADTYTTKDGSRVRVDLKQNFRSRREVTDCVNGIFSQIMHRVPGGVEYDENAALYPAACFPENEEAVSPYEPEFLVAAGAEDGMSDRQREALMIADRIQSLVGNLPVRDRESMQLRKARYRDIVILLRSAAGWDEEIKKALTEAGIPVHVTSRTGYFAAKEVQTVLNFLRVLNNPLQDIPLFGVLRSEAGGFSDEQIAMLRTLDDTGKRSLFDCVRLAALTKPAEELAEDSGAKGRPTEEQPVSVLPVEKCRAFLSLLERYREYAVYLPIHSLIEQFLRETGYLYTVSAMPGGAQRRINVEMLLSRAENFEKTSYTGLFHFIRYMEQLDKYQIDYGETGALDENADIVRIMSIHKSKGLEFPVCIVAGLSRKFNRQDSAQPVLMDMELGLAADYVDPVLRVKRPTIKKNVMAHKLKMESLGEELRVLYVAMTRAEEKLILTASCKEDKLPVLEEKGTDGMCPAAVSPVQLSEAGSFYDILSKAFPAAGGTITCVSAADFMKEDIARHISGRNERQRLYFLQKEDCGSRRDMKRLSERFNTPYAHQNLAGLFVVTTVSELKKAVMQEDDEKCAKLYPEEEVIPYVPRFIRKAEESPGGSLRGSAYHRVLELFPFGEKEGPSGWTAPEVRKVMGGLVEKGALTAEYASLARPDKIALFTESRLARRMRSAQNKGLLRREQPFVLGLPAKDLQRELPETETVLIQGIIDVFFEEEGGLVVADYKTDAVKEAEELRRRYKVQLDYYAKALEQMTGRPVKEKIIYSFALGCEITV